MNLFILYPSVYARFAKNGALFLDTESNNSIIFSKEEAYNIRGLESGFIEITKGNSHYLGSLINKSFGYLMSCDKYPIYLNSINFTSSKSKLVTSSVFLDGTNSLSYIDRIGVFIDALSYEFFNNNLALLLDFPKESTYDITTYRTVFSKITFPNLREIEIVSSLTERAIEFAQELQQSGYYVTFKTVIYNDIDFAKALSVTSSFADITFKVYVNASLIPFANDLPKTNVYCVYWSTSLKEILRNPECRILPILYNIASKKDLLTAVRLNKDDILNSNYSGFQLKYNSLFNASFMGRITFAEHYVLSGNQKICNISEFPEKYSAWLYDLNNVWFYSRNKKRGCKDCIFCDLCPSISLMELNNIFPTPCSSIHEELNLGNVLQSISEASSRNSNL